MGIKLMAYPYSDSDSVLLKRWSSEANQKPHYIPRIKMLGKWGVNTPYQGIYFLEDKKIDVVQLSVRFGQVAFL
jgi:hypothetical protein